MSNREQVPKAGQQIVHHAALDARLVPLPVVAERRAFLQRDHALVRIDLARDHAQQRALARPIGRYEPRALPRLQPKRNALKQALVAVPKTQIRNIQKRQSARDLARLRAPRTREQEITAKTPERQKREKGLGARSAAGHAAAT